MITVKANSLFQHKVAIRDKYIEMAEKCKEDLQIIYLTEQMVIPYREIEERIVGRSKSAVPDYFSEEFHFLIYFQWKPNKVQRSLI